MTYCKFLFDNRVSASCTEIQAFLSEVAALGDVIFHGRIGERYAVQLEISKAPSEAVHHALKQGCGQERQILIKRVFLP